MKLLDFIFLVTRLYLVFPLHPNPAHLQPFGSVGSLISIKELEQEFPDESKFFNNYIPQAEPALFRQVLNKDRSFSIWQTDEQLKSEVHGLADMDIELDIFQGQRPAKLQITFGEFLQRIQKEPLFYANDVPTILQKYLVVPRPLQCEAVLDTLQSAFLIIGTPNSSPLLISEEHDYIHCVLRGSKRLVLVDASKYPEVRKIVVPEKRDQVRPFVNPDRVDLKTFPALADIDHHVANLTAGDCLFVPNDWIFQERSTENTISVIYNIKHGQALNVDKEELNNCPKYDPTFTLDQIDWSVERHPQSFKDLIVNLINTKTQGFEKWQKAFSKHLSYDIGSDSEVSNVFEEFYGIIDIDGDGEVTSAEFDQINGAHQHHITDILYEMAQMIHNKRKTSTTKPVNVDEQPVRRLTDDEKVEDEFIHIQNYKTDL